MDIVPFQPADGINKVPAPAANTRKEITVNGLAFRVNAAGAGALGGNAVAGVPLKANNVRREVGGAGLNYRVNAAAAGAGVKKK